MSLKQLIFRDIDLNDRFFESLKADYPGFDVWFRGKNAEPAYISHNEYDEIDGFLYLKIEDEALLDMTPTYPKKKRVKMGTFKIEAHGTKLGERFLRIVINFAMKNNIKDIYVTIFDKHIGLIRLIERFGFSRMAIKNEPTPNGQEGVYFKSLEWRD